MVIDILSALDSDDDMRKKQIENVIVSLKALMIKLDPEYAQENSSKVIAKEKM